MSSTSIGANRRHQHYIWYVPPRRMSMAWRWDREFEPSAADGNFVDQGTGLLSMQRITWNMWLPHTMHWRRTGRMRRTGAVGDAIR